jgi:hypothetical protein
VSRWFRNRLTLAHRARAVWELRGRILDENLGASGDLWHLIGRLFTSISIKAANVTTNLDDDPYTDADLAAIFAAPGVPMFSNMNPFLEARLQHFAVNEVESQGVHSKEGASGNAVAGSQQTESGPSGQQKGTGSWTWELAQLFNQGFGQEYGEPFVRFYREASRSLINSDYVKDKGVDLSYLLFKMQQGKPEELSSENILDILQKQLKK